jgi:invasion protein IalB
MNKFKAAGLFVLFISLCLFTTSPSLAQKPGIWETVCADRANPKTCRLRQDLFLQKKNKDGKLKTIGRVLRLNVIYSNVEGGSNRVPFLSIQVPMGVDLRAGTAFQIDESKEISLPFLRCTTQGCDASVRLKSEILRNMKAGNEFKVGFRRWGDPKISVISASLKGFTAAFSAIR